MPIQNSLNLYGTTPYIVYYVNPITGAHSCTGSYKTIQSAINAAKITTGNVVITEGTYTEDLNLENQVNLIALIPGSVSIFGTVTAAYEGYCSIINVNFYGSTTTPGLDVIQFSGTGGSGMRTSLYLYTCQVGDSSGSSTSIHIPYNMNANSVYIEIHSSVLYSGDAPVIDFESPGVFIMSETTISASGTHPAINLNASVSFNCYYSYITNPIGGECVLIGNSSINYFSYYSTYFSIYAPIFHYTAGGTITSQYDLCSSQNPKGYFAAADGSLWKFILNLYVSNRICKSN